MTSVLITCYSDGRRCGEAQIDFDRYVRHAQWPGGLILAGDILSHDDLTRMSLDPITTVWCDGEDGCLSNELSQES